MSDARAVTALLEALDAQASILEAMVSASQRQVAAILQYRADFRKEQPDALTQAQTEMKALLEELGRANDSVKVAGAALPAAQRPASVLERMSDVRSLAQALSELQKISQFHCQRGLQLISAWREQLASAANPGPTYARNGRTRVRTAVGMSTASVLEVDL